MATETNSRERRLQELSNSNYEIADGEPDIRGWDVKDASGRRIGEVDDLIFDTVLRKVRYIKLDLEGNTLDLEPRDVLVPIGLAELREKGDDVILNNVSADQLRSLPEYDEDNLDSDFEGGVRRVFGDANGAAMAGAAGVGGALLGDTGNTREQDADFYSHEHFNEENLYRNRRQNAASDNDATGETIPVIKEELEVGKREVERGGIRLRSRIVETPVEETVNLREESVNVERTPVNRAASDADFREDAVEMRERAEVPVVNKEARVVEEITLNKEVEERNETIRDTVRETKVDVDKLEGNDRRNSTDLDTDRF